MILSEFGWIRSSCLVPGTRIKFVFCAEILDLFTGLGNCGAPSTGEDRSGKLCIRWGKVGWWSRGAGDRIWLRVPLETPSRAVPASMWVNLFLLGRFLVLFVWFNKKVHAGHSLLRGSVSFV